MTVQTLRGRVRTGPDRETDGISRKAKGKSGKELLEYENELSSMYPISITNTKKKIIGERFPFFQITNVRIENFTKKFIVQSSHKRFQPQDPVYENGFGTNSITV